MLRAPSLQVLLLFVGGFACSRLRCSEACDNRASKESFRAPGSGSPCLGTFHGKGAQASKSTCKSACKGTCEAN